MNKKIWFVSVLVISLVGCAHRGNIHSLRIDERQAHQAERIQQGINSGALTVPETRKLFRQQRRIKALEAEYKSNGHFTKSERMHIHELLDQASQDIRNKKTNARRRY